MGLRVEIAHIGKLWHMEACLHQLDLLVNHTKVQPFKSLLCSCIELKLQFEVDKGHGHTFPP